MRLLYISNARIPTEKAHGIHIMKMCEAFTLNNIEASLVIPRRFNKIQKDPFEYYGVERNFKIKKLSCLDLIPWDKYLGYLALWLESLSFFFFVFFYLLSQKADVIYIRDKSLLPLSLFKKNIIFESHTFPKNYFLYSLFLKKTKGTVVITSKLKELFGGKVLVVPDGVDLKMFDISCSKSEARQKLNLPQDKKIVLYAGHHYKWKGTQTLAEASKYLPENIKVIFVSNRPYAEIPYWLKSADVLVLPNSGKEEISKYWTSPLKMFEYMASKRPIVASILPSIKEILNESNSVLVEPDNPKALAEGIQLVLQNPGLSDKISEKAFLDVQQYTWQKRAQIICQKLINT